MTLAIRGDRASCSSMQLGPGTWLLAVASGFGKIAGLPAEAALLARLRGECRRRMRNPLFRRAVDRPQAAATAMLSVLSRINAALYACTASHEDYVPAAASLTAVIVVQRFAYVIHAGATAAYLVRARAVTPLCEDDVMEERSVPLLSRAFAVAPTLDVSITNARLVRGDAIVLLPRRIAGESELRGLVDRLDRAEAGEQMLVARFEEDLPLPVNPGGSPGSRRARSGMLWAYAAATAALIAAAVFAH
jgi:hypothetical protein